MGEEFLVPHETSKFHDEKIPREDCETFMPSLDSLLKMAAKWLQKGLGTDI